jgi:hypothetical protein
MERKIGEIFNYQDNWYQCIENTGYGCIICHFNTHNNICCNNVLNIIIVSAILIKLKWNDKCTIGDLLWGLFLVVLSPASLIVIIIVELIDSGFFKKVYKLWN